MTAKVWSMLTPHEAISDDDRAGHLLIDVRKDLTRELVEKLELGVRRLPEADGLRILTSAIAHLQARRA